MQIYDLLMLNYVEDDDAMFRWVSSYAPKFLTMRACLLKYPLNTLIMHAGILRHACFSSKVTLYPICRFKYTHDFLQWALQPPGYKTEWHIGVRVKGNNKLVGFITGTHVRHHTARHCCASYSAWSAIQMLQTFCMRMLQYQREPLLCCLLALSYWLLMH